MLRLAADENFNADVVRAIRRRLPTLDFITAQDAGLQGAGDPAILEWAASENRILFTHDVSTVTAFAYERIQGGKPLPGVFVVSLSVPLKQIIEDILLIVECSEADEWKNRVHYLPLR
jgi:predicted nuclease of predicted toxin-antitoxin system